MGGGEPAGGVLGIDIGGTKVGLRFEAGDHIHEVRANWPDGGVRADLGALAELVATAATDWGGTVSAVGIAMPGTLSPAGEVLAWPGRPSWLGVELGRELAAIVPGVPVRWADDGDLGALAEARQAGLDSLVYLGVGTGVGGGLVLDGAMVPGTGRGSCEIGHLVVGLGGPRCDCGRSGCVQAYACGPAVLRRAAALAGAPVSPEGLVAGVGDEAAWAVQALDGAAQALAVAVIGVEELVHVGNAVIGGGFAAVHPFLVRLVEQHVELSRRPGQQPIRVRGAVLGGLSSLRGAVELARSPHPNGAAVRTSG